VARGRSQDSANRAEETFQTGGQDVDQYDRDLNPDGMAGRNVAGQSPDPVHAGNAPTAFNIKAVHGRLNGLHDDDLKAIPIVPEGTRLQQGATYIDLLGDRQEFTATGEMTAEKHHAYAPKDSIDYQLWNRLIGVTNPERAGNSHDASISD
jgi:hypothetical protein